MISSFTSYISKYPLSKETHIVFSTLINDLQIEDITTFANYLMEIWRDLTTHSLQPLMGIDESTFSTYFELPGIISNRLFWVFDRNNKGYLNPKDFIEGMMLLFSGQFSSLVRFIFKIYDFNNKGFITKKDVHLILSYIPYNNKYNTFVNKIKSQEEIYDIIEMTFEDKEILNIREFIYVVENKRSDIFMFVLCFLLENKPFSNESIKLIANETNKNNKVFVSRTPIPEFHKIISPSTVSKFLSPALRNKTYRCLRNNNKEEHEHTNNNIDNNSNLIRNKKTKRNNLRERFEKIENDQSLQTNFILSNYLNNNNTKYANIETNNESLSLSKPLSNVVINENNRYKEYDENNLSFNSCDSISINDNDNDNNSDNDSTSTASNSPETTQHEGYLYKLTNNNSLKKVYFKLINKDLFFYKSKDDSNHRGIHSLTGAFLKTNEPTIIHNQKYFPFTILYPNKPRPYYVDSENEYNSWINSLNSALNIKNIFDAFEIKDRIGKGKFGLVRLGLHKLTNKPYAIKIMSKSTMNSSDLDLVKTEINILKVCQHPNIIKLYNVYDSFNYIYIVMEHCSGGDLFSYIERRHFKIPEIKVCEIVHKISMALYYLHSHGIIHRDLKPENILMTDNTDYADVKLLDFGLSKITGPNDLSNEPYGTLSYVAPEVLREIPYDKKVDIWSLGITTYFLLCGFLPFDDRFSDREIARKTMHEPVPYPDEIFKYISNEAKDFIDKTLKKNPFERPNIENVLEHKWFSKCSKSPIIRQLTKDKHICKFELYANDNNQI